MRVSLLAHDAPAWASFLSEVDHDFYHLPAYVALSAVEEGGEPVALLVEDGGRAMLLPLIVRPIVGAGRDAVSPYGYPGPLRRGTDDPTFLHDALLAGSAMLATQGIVAVFVRFHPLIHPTPPDAVGTIVRHGDTVAIDLSGSDDTQWRETRSDHRSQISRAQRAGRVAAFDESWSHYGAFKDLYSATMTRVAAAPLYQFDDAYFDGLRVALGDRIRLCVVEIDDVVAAAGLFVETCGIVQFHLSCSDPRFNREAPSKLMIDYVRRWAKERGDKLFHLGGGLGAADDSLFRFKSGFSKRRYPFHTLRIVCDEPEYARLVRAHDPGADPARRDGFFPAYRKM